jgi:hypothetical protein
LLLTGAAFTDHYYYTAIIGVGVIAMGDWERNMAPPSILEFIHSLVLKDAIWSVSPAIGSHLETRGCLFDFSAKLSDLRQSVLIGSICSECKAAMEYTGQGAFVADLAKVLSREWLHDTSNPASPASVVAKLKHDLFITKGLTPSPRESIKMALVQDGTKQVLQIAGAVISGVLLAALVLVLGLKGSDTPSPKPVPSTAPSTASSR